MTDHLSIAAAQRRREQRTDHDCIGCKAYREGFADGTLITIDTAQSAFGNLALYITEHPETTIPEIQNALTYLGANLIALQIATQLVASGNTQPTQQDALDALRKMFEAGS